jgi:hypothetical protein
MERGASRALPCRKRDTVVQVSSMVNGEMANVRGREQLA